MKMRLVVRFDYGSIVQCIRRLGDRLEAVAGPDALELLVRCGERTVKGSRRARISR